MPSSFWRSCTAFLQPPGTANYSTATTPIPVVDGLGRTRQGMHTAEEWLDLASLWRRIVQLADLLATL